MLECALTTRTEKQLTRPVQHHFVTRSYLEGFTDGKGQLHIYERSRERPFILSPEKAARQRNYYAIRPTDGTLDDTVEAFLNDKVESPAIAVVRKLANSNDQPSWDERTALARWISFQEFRTPLRRGGIEEIAAKLAKEMMVMMARAPGVLEDSLEKLKEQGKDVEGGSRIDIPDGR